MKRIIIRHAETDGSRLDRHAWGIAGAPLNKVGRIHAQELGTWLMANGIDPKRERVAVSELIRTRQTALEAGFPEEAITVNRLLNEVNTPDPDKTVMLIERRELPAEAYEAGRVLLANPPTESIWVTHGLVIAAMNTLLNLQEFIPNQATATIIDI